MKSKLIKILLLILIIIAIFNNYKVHAEDLEYYKPTITEDSGLADKAGIILGYINLIGVIVSVITVTIIGIRYLLGSVEERAEYKKTAIYFLIGAFLIFSTTTIPNLIYNLF